MEKSYNELISGNKKWAEKMLAKNPNYFTDLSKGQKPPVLWIGCSDSRVPANEITGTSPGEVFVHRNIANMVVHSDMNLLSVLDYAVNILEVKHVIVCGHYGCGGVLAAMEQKQFGIVDNWLRHIKDVYRMYKDELDAITDITKRGDRFVELNVIEQVFDLSKTSIIQNAWKKRQQPQVHGWVYDIKTGLINDLNISISDNSEMPEFYKVEHLSK